MRAAEEAEEKLYSAALVAGISLYDTVFGSTQDPDLHLPQSFNERFVHAYVRSRIRECASTGKRKRGDKDESRPGEDPSDDDDDDDSYRPNKKKGARGGGGGKKGGGDGGGKKGGGDGNGPDPQPDPQPNWVPLPGVLEWYKYSDQQYLVSSHSRFLSTTLSILMFAESFSNDTVFFTPYAQIACKDAGVSPFTKPDASANLFDSVDDESECSEEYDGVDIDDDFLAAPPNDISGRLALVKVNDVSDDVALDVSVENLESPGQSFYSLFDGPARDNFKVIAVDHMGYIGNFEFSPKVRLENLAKKGVVSATDWIKDGGDLVFDELEEGVDFAVRVGDFIRVKDGDVDQMFCLVRLFKGEYYGQPSFETFQLSYQLHQTKSRTAKANGGEELFRAAFGGDDGDAETLYKMPPTFFFDYHASELERQFYDHTATEAEAAALKLASDDDGIGLIFSEGNDDLNIEKVSGSRLGVDSLHSRQGVWT